MNDFNLQNENFALKSILTVTDAFDDVRERYSILSDNSSVSIVLTHVIQILSLNLKQFLIVKKMLTHLLQTKTVSHHTFESSQLLLYVEEENEVRKSQVIKEIAIAMKLLTRRDELIVMTSIESAANNVSDSIVHSSLDIAIDKRVSKNVKDRVRKL